MTVDRFVEHQRRVAAQQAEQRRATSMAVRSRLPAVVEDLVGRGCTRIILFGSVARGEADDESDVDLAVAGLPAADLFEAMAAAWARAGRPVDLVRLEEASPTLRARIETDGEVIFDAR